MFAGTPTFGQIRCALDRPNSDPSSIRFAIDGSTINDFLAQTVISSDSPDLRPGYAAWTCLRELNHFDQVNEELLLVLKHRDAQGGIEESLQCRVFFRVTEKTVRVFTSGCTSSCMTFDVTFEKASKFCRHES